MPQRKHVVPVACESCRKRRTRCDGATPLCSPCLSRGAQCVYNSHPGMSRLVALKSEHTQLKSSYDNLMRLYRRLKQGSALEVSSIIEEIKSSDEILDMSAHKARISPSLNCAQLATDRLGLKHQNEFSQPGSLELMKRETSATLDRKPKSTPSYSCTSRNADSTGVPLRIHDNSYQNDSRTINWHTTFRHVAYTNSENESIMGFSVGYEPLLKGLLRCNLDRIRLGFTMLRSWNIGSRDIHGIEEFDHLFSVLYYERHKTISRSRLCEMCAIATISGQYVRQLLAPGLINYWYDATVYFFEECVRVAPKNAIKVTTLLALSGVRDD